MCVKHIVCMNCECIECDFGNLYTAFEFSGKTDIFVFIITMYFVNKLFVMFFYKFVILFLA